MEATFEQRLAAISGLFQKGDVVRLKAEVADGDTGTAKIERFYTDIDGGVLLDRTLNEFVSWNLTDLDRVDTLRDFITRDGICGLSDNDPVHQMLDVEVIERVNVHDAKRWWPGKHRNVHVYVRLANGKIVGHNENPNTGWSFPVMKDPQA